MHCSYEPGFWRLKILGSTTLLCTRKWTKSTTFLPLISSSAKWPKELYLHIGLLRGLYRLISESLLEYSGTKQVLNKVLHTINLYLTNEYLAYHHRGPDDEQKDGEHKRGSQDLKGCVHPWRGCD